MVVKIHPEADKMMVEIQLEPGVAFMFCAKCQEARAGITGLKLEHCCFNAYFFQFEPAKK
jgi:hypothetical protein